jgi:hypothetical protein
MGVRFRGRSRPIVLNVSSSDFDPKQKMVSVLETSPLDHTNTFRVLRQCRYPRYGRDLADLAALAIQDNELPRQPAHDLADSSDCEHIQSTSSRFVA